MSNLILLFRQNEWNCYCNLMTVLSFRLKSFNSAVEFVFYSARMYSILSLICFLVSTVGFVQPANVQR